MRTIISLMLVFAVIAYSCSKKTVPGKSDTGIVTPPADTLAVAPTPPAPPPAVTAGKELFLAKCGKCHALKQPETFTSDRWTAIMERMAPKARLNEDEKKNVVAYVHFYAKK